MEINVRINIDDIQMFFDLLVYQINDQIVVNMLNNLIS
jgi:hypothetical protein